MDCLNANETIELIDLEPREEVVGGVSSGMGYAVLTVGGIHSTARAAARWEQVITGDLPNAT